MNVEFAVLIMRMTVIKTNLVSRTNYTQVDKELNFELYNTQSMESSPYDTNTGYNLLKTTRIHPDPGEFPRNSKNGQ